MPVLRQPVHVPDGLGNGRRASTGGFCHAAASATSGREIVITDAQAARLDCVLDRQLNAIRRAAAQLEGERMAAEADAFIDALHRDLIDAADFA